MTDQIVLGEWLYDEKEVPELALQDQWRPEQLAYQLGKAGEAFSLPREFFRSGVHTHCRGKTGSGKSSRVLLPLLMQLMEPYKIEWTSDDGMTRTITEQDAFLVIDLGGDKSLFHATRKRAEELGRRFRFLSLDSNHSEKFDPFQSIKADGHRIIRLCNLFLEAFSLDHGLAYGGSWYSQRNLLLLLSICERLVARKQSGQDISLREVDRYLADPNNGNIKDAEQIRGIFSFLLRYGQLQPCAADDSINMRESILNRDVVYAYLPSISEATTARQIAGLMLYVTVNAAMSLYEESEGSSFDRPQPHLHVVIDEFHTLAGTAFESLLTGARKYGISMYLANQTTESLVKRDIDLSSVVRDNCGLRLYQTVTGKQDFDELQNFSAEATRILKSTKAKESVRYKGKGAFGTESYSQQVTTLLSKREIQEVSATEGAMFAIVDDGKGQREPIPLITKYHLTRGEFLKYRSQTLPDTSQLYDDSVNPALLSSLPAWQCTHLEPAKSPALTARLERLRSLRNQLEAEFGPG
ncbi:type IV secretory system conjugative DNA transfer family protein [Botrimarina mediterranea]|uniref:AAA-like domain protein n=1 Tax=Botrimarina mediterranea TaxID=2528022 RepID=A0A518K628_9BACT|nr:TraM recognition domain-containing protein [Botrimarina mediterranea]QDV73239.1 AAA-like domain protein [Botrimarina mediterranea]